MKRRPTTSQTSSRRQRNATYQFQGEELTVTEIAKRENVNIAAIYHRLRRTSSIEAKNKHRKHVLTKTRWDKKDQIDVPNI